RVLAFENLEVGVWIAGRRCATAERIDTQGYHPRRLWQQALWAVLECFTHKAHPDRQGNRATIFVTAQAGRLVETAPHRSDQVGVVAGEPAVLGLIGRTGLAGQVGALQGQGAPAGAAGDDVLQHAGEDIAGAWVDDLLCAWRHALARRDTAAG